jgi:hypothetical protein
MDTSTTGSLDGAMLQVLRNATHQQLLQADIRKYVSLWEAHQQLKGSLATLQRNYDQLQNTMAQHLSQISTRSIPKVEDIISVNGTSASRRQSQSSTPPQAEMTTVTEDSTIFLKLECYETKERIAFKLKRNTPLDKIQDAYARRKGKEVHILRFLYDSERIVPSRTPLDYEMEDGDLIEVWPLSTFPCTRQLLA